MVNCKICNLFFKTLVGHLIHKHNLKPREYLEIYPDSEIISKEQKNKISESTKLAMRRPDVREKYEKFLKTHDFSSRKPKFDRNDPNIKKRMYCAERNKKVSNARKEYWKQRKGKNLEELYGEEKAKKIKKIKSDQTKGKNNPAYGKVYNNVGRIKGYYKNMFFRSIWEYSFLKYIENCGYDLQYITYEKISIPFIFKDVERTYRPDFYLIKENKLIEIKSKWHLEQDKELINAKRIAAEEWCKNNNSTYQILTEDDFPVLSKNIFLQDKNVTLTKQSNVDGA